MTAGGGRPRVLFVAPSAYPLGGLATWLDMLMPGLVERGWDVLLGLTEGRFHDPDAYLAAHPWQEVVRIANPTGTAEGRVRAVIRAIEKARPQVVASVNVPDCLEAAAVAPDPPRAVMTLHGIQEDLIAETARRAGEIDGIVCANRLARELVIEASGLPPQRILYAPCGVDVPSAPPARPASDELKMLYAGRLEQSQKRIFDLPDILARLDELEVPWSLRIAGTGPDEGELRRLLDVRGLRGSVELLGDVSHARLLTEILPACDALVITSLWETGPIVAWEAMAAGVPVVSSRYVGSGLEGSLRRDETCLLFPVGDAEAAAAELARLREPNLRELLRRNAFALVTERYSRRASAEAWDRALRSILALPRSSRAGRTRRGSAGRLDALLGARAAETARGLLRRRFEHSEPGGEWPHAYGAPTSPGFWDHASRADTP